MKTKHYILLGLAMITTALSSCTSDDTADDNSSDIAAGKYVEIGANVGAFSRVTLSENGTTQDKGLAAVWTAGDNMTIVNGSKSNTAETFTLISGATFSTGKFACTTSTVEAGNQIYGFYPAKSTTDAPTSMTDLSGITATIDYSSQEGTINYVGKNVVMTAAQIFQVDGETAAFTCNKATSILRVNVSLPAEATVKYIILSATGLWNKTTIIPSATGGTAAMSMLNAGNITATLNGGLGTLATGGKLVVYLNVFPQSLASGFSITAITTEGDVYTYTNSATNVAFKAGLVHSINKSGNPFTKYELKIGDGLTNGIGIATWTPSTNTSDDNTWN